MKLAPPLSEAKIAASKPREKVYKLTDGGRGGLYLLVSPKGARTWYIRQIHTVDGKRKEIPKRLGRWPAVSLQVARHLASTMANVRSRPEVGVMSFEDVAHAWMNVHLRDKSTTHAKTVRERLEKHVFPFTRGMTPWDALSANTVHDVVQRIVDAGSLEVARRIIGILSQIRDHATDVMRIEGLEHVENIRGKRRIVPVSVEDKHHAAPVTEAELRHVWRTILGYQGSESVAVLLKLTVMLGQRPVEMRTMKWADIDLDKGTWTLAYAKQRARKSVKYTIVHKLPRQALEILRGLVSRQVSAYVMPTPRSWGRPLSEVAGLAALRSLGIGKDEATMHGFRSTLRTMAREKRFASADVLEMLISHQTAEEMGRAYDRTRLVEERGELLQKWCDYLDELART